MSDFCGPMDCSPTGSFVHGISQARILKWVAKSYSRGSSRSRDQTSSLVGRFLPLAPHRTQIYTHAYICTYTYIHTHTHIYIYMHYKVFESTTSKANESNNHNPNHKPSNTRVIKCHSLGKK